MRTAFVLALSLAAAFAPADNAQALDPLACARDALGFAGDGWLSHPIAEIQKVNFPKHYYEDITRRMKAKVEEWVRNAEHDGELQSTFITHRTHLESLERDLFRYRALLEAEGYSIERLQAQIWVHDIGKFVDLKNLTPEGSLVKGRFVDPDRRILLRHASNPEFQSAVFLDHSKTSQMYLLENPFFKSEGKIDNVTRQLYYDIAGHDGPAVAGSWWGDHYAVTRRPHPTIPGRFVGGNYPGAESPILQLLDRLDQPSLSLRGKELIGGPNKIARQQRAFLLKSGVRRPQAETEAIWESLYSVPEGTYAQYQEMVERYRHTESPVIHAMLDDLRNRIERVRELRQRTKFFSLGEGMPREFRTARPSSAPPNAIGYVIFNGQKRYFSSVETFYGTQESAKAALPWAHEMLR